jgi:hypothetical protein
MLGLAATAPAGGCAMAGIESRKPIKNAEKNLDCLNNFFIILLKFNCKLRRKKKYIGCPNINLNGLFTDDSSI